MTETMIMREMTFFFQGFLRGTKIDIATVRYYARRCGYKGKIEAEKK